jgi:hypothetical protein
VWQALQPRLIVNAKNMKSNLKAVSYTGEFAEIPSIRFQGKWLTKELGIRPGDKIEVTLANGQVSFRKHEVPADPNQQELPRL